MHTSPLESAAVQSASGTGSKPAIDSVSIRGVELPTAGLFNRSLLAPERRQALREKLTGADPFPYLALDDCFDPRLLELVLEEFEMPEWQDVKSAYESTRRSVLGAKMGPATQLYFDITNSGWFTQWLSDVTGVDYLLPDPKLFGGGLHESREGATFAVHRDFNYHRYNGLKNEMVFITYLNRGWDPAWGGALELWDGPQGSCRAQVIPEFGRTLILPHGPGSYHGHPHPMTPPPGRTRRSIAAYYYTSPLVDHWREDQVASRFMHTRRIDRAKKAIRMVVPPICWAAARAIVKR